MKTPSRFPRTLALLVGGVLLVGTGTASAQVSFTKLTNLPPGMLNGNSPGAGWVDYDGDGDLDLFVVNTGSNPNYLFRNDGGDTFTRITTGALVTDQMSARGLCWADYDNDDDLDVFVTSGVAGQAALYQNDGQGGFARLGTATVLGVGDVRSWACTWGDYDRDGFVDLFLTHPAGFSGNPTLKNFLFHNRGDGTFEHVTPTPPSSATAPFTVATWSDYDLDGDLDLFIGSGPAGSVPGPDYLYRNLLTESGTADFERIVEGPVANINRDGQVINWIDYDNDGDLDVFITNWGGGLGGGLADELYRNDGGTLTAVDAGPMTSDKRVSLSSVWADFDNDGDLDVFVTNGSGGVASRYYENLGEDTFANRTNFPVSNDLAPGWGATAGDYDDDGDLDLFVANVSNPAATLNYFYRNDTANDNHWLKVRTVGVASNRAGIGAVLRARATIGGAQVWQMRDVSSQNTFVGHNSLDVHFGLGDATVVDELEITWPSGEVEVYRDLPADQLLVATEGKAPTANEAERVVPEGYELEQNYPNPFNPETTIRYRLPQRAHVTLRVYNAAGDTVATLVDEVRSAGPHESTFDATDLPSGAYLYRIEAGPVTITKTMTVVK